MVSILYDDVSVCRNTVLNGIYRLVSYPALKYYSKNKLYHVIFLK